MFAVILAGGGLSAEDPLREKMPEGVPANKAFLPVAGKPALQWVLDAISASDLIEGLIITGRTEEESWTSSKPLHFLPDQGSLTGNARAGLRLSSELAPELKHTLMSSGDIPLITTEMVTWAVQHSQSLDADLVYHVITQEAMEARFPGSNRTFVPLKDIRVCGGDLNVLANRIVDSHAGLWDRLAEARKSPFKQAAIFGPGVLIGLLLRRFDLNSLAGTLGKRLDLDARAVVCPYPEMGMDIDKPYQYDLVIDELK